MSETDTAGHLAAKEWTMRLYLFEEGPRTVARVVLDTGDNTLEAHGEAHRNPHDAPVPEIGDEIAAGRALTALGERLTRTAVVDIEDLAARRAGGDAGA
jgi:uncharacterized protein DUF1876